jgi:hypothetical protein
MSSIDASRLSDGAFAPQRARVTYGMLALGLGLFLVGTVALGSAQGSADALAKNGVHVSAIVTNYWPSIRGSSPRITVSYSTPSGVETNVPVWVDETVSYRVGQVVGISYDSSDPTRAALRKGDSASPVAGVYFFMLFCGLGLTLKALHSLLIRKRRQRALVG